MNTKLIKTMERHHLDRSDLVKILGVSPHTVRSWLLPDTSKARRQMPAQMLELLNLKLEK